LNGPNGFAIRQKAVNYLDKYTTTTRAERKSKTEQGSGLLAGHTFKTKKILVAL